MAHGGALLVEQGRHHVHRLEELVVVADREALGVRERHLEFRRELVRSHGELPSPISRIPGSELRARVRWVPISGRCGCRDRNQAENA